MVQFAQFAEGGFVVHKFRAAGSESKFSAWFSVSGALIDAERIDRRGRSYHVKPNSAAWRELESRGPNWAAAIKGKAV